MNVVIGRWKAKHHKTLVNYAKGILRNRQVQVQIRWIKRTQAAWETSARIRASRPKRPSTSDDTLAALDEA